MKSSAWDRLVAALPSAPREPWLPAVLARNAHTAYLRSHGSPQTLESFRESVPVVGHEQLLSWLERIQCGEPDVLFAGRPVAYERTGGSTGGAKLVPFSEEGLADFRRAVLPWLAGAVRAHGVTGRAYFSISPATRRPERVGDVPVGLPDGAYLGEAASVLDEVSAVPLGVQSIADVARWRAETLRHLAAADDLELVSVWSPTFLLRLLDDLPDPVSLWPRLKLVSCWASGASRPFAAELAARLPHAHLQPKGLLSTECVVTVPDADDRPVLTEHGFFEFEREGRLHRADELAIGSTYGVVATTASGLYRYRTGDLVRCDGSSRTGRPVLEFVGRGEFASDLVGEKLAEPFVEWCLEGIAAFRMVVPATEGNGYALLVERGSRADVTRVERRLCANPQYAHARQLGQLAPLRLVEVPDLFDRYVGFQLERGQRLGDVKPVALRAERDWTVRLGGTP